MLSQLELLKAQVARLTAKGGPDSPFVKGLKAQIASYEKPRAENPMASPQRISGGMRSTPNQRSSSSPVDLNAGAAQLLEQQLSELMPGMELPAKDRSPQSESITSSGGC